ncbi:MAG: ATP-dependent helicase HrpB [bacterium]|nr:ATP-dependent helicase HrpB [Candidatus Colisoma equi]
MFPVEERVGEIAAALARNRDVVLTAPPGSGKTTCVPPALLDASWLQGKKIVMLEPRRIAARNCATYISRKLGEPVGGTVGYQVRLERKVSAKTRLEIVTEGLLTNRLLADPELSDVGLVIFDEFHERSLQCDLAFALALEVRRALRPDLRILVMSATLDADEVAAHLGDADIVRAEGRMFPVETIYLGDMSMSAAISKALKETDGDVLCFLPGEGEIKRTIELSNNRIIESGGAQVLPLYGSLNKEEQDRVFEESAKRKVILATSIAETSVTIEGIACVIDSGLMRVPRFSPATGMSGLVTLPLTQDRAEQRRGRAGRVRAGVCYRLWTEGQQQSRPKKMMPEILETDLCSLVLTSAAWGAFGREDLPWMTPPAASLWEQAVGLLKMLGALDDTGRLTEKGKTMAKMPMHPRLANMLLATGEKHEVEKLEVKVKGEGEERNVAVLAAIIEEGSKSRETDIRYVPVTSRIKELSKKFAHHCSPSPYSFTLSEGSALALAYPDRIAKNRGNGTFRMVNGRGAFLPEDDPMAKEPYIVCCELDDRTGDAKVFLGCPISEGEILELFGDKVIEEAFCEWDRQNERVKSVIRRKLGEMTLGEKPSLASSVSGLMSSVLIEGIRIKGVDNLPCWGKESLQMRARINFLNRVLPTPAAEGRDGTVWPRIDEATVLPALEGFVGGMTKWRDLEKLDIAAVMDFILSEHGHDRRELDRLAPTRMEVPSGSHMTIHYEGDEPTVEVRLQECFGLMETPKVAGGKVPIVMTLLSPAQRPIQITKDLAGFWKGAYQLVRKDMRGRYPKHYWPEDPLTAVATRRVRPR